MPTGLATNAPNSFNLNHIKPGHIYDCGTLLCRAAKSVFMQLFRHNSFVFAMFVNMAARFTAGENRQHSVFNETNAAPVSRQQTGVCF